MLFLNEALCYVVKGKRGVLDLRSIVTEGLFIKLDQWDLWKLQMAPMGKEHECVQ
jgi:hypothetical protein